MNFGEPKRSDLWIFDIQL